MYGYLLFFFYYLYTFSACLNQACPTSSSSSGGHTGTIVGVVVALVVIASIAVGGYFVWRYKIKPTRPSYTLAEQVEMQNESQNETVPYSNPTDDLVTSFVLNTSTPGSEPQNTQV